jgi:hypothetical protein
MANNILDPAKLEEAWHQAWMKDPMSLRFELADQSKEAYYRDGVKTLNNLIDFFSDKKIIFYNQQIFVEHKSHIYSTHIDVCYLNEKGLAVPCIFVDHELGEMQSVLDYRLSAAYQYYISTYTQPVDFISCLSLSTTPQLQLIKRSMFCKNELNNMIENLGNELDSFNDPSYTAYQRSGNWCSACYYKDKCKGFTHVN